jgi:hypothetical protein
MWVLEEDTDLSLMFTLSKALRELPDQWWQLWKSTEWRWFIRIVWEETVALQVRFWVRSRRLPTNCVENRARRQAHIQTDQWLGGGGISKSH